MHSTDTDHGLSLVRRLNALFSERDARVAAADGWLTQTDPAWREDWKARKDALLGDMHARNRTRGTA